MPDSKSQAGESVDSSRVVGRSEGWCSLLNARDAHYFRDGRSLCGRWGCFGTPLWEPNQELGQRPRRNSGTCVTCWKKREKEETANIKNQGRDSAQGGQNER
jgi:hypothetical protein